MGKVGRTVHKGCVRLRWVEPRHFTLAEVRDETKKVVAPFVRGVILGVGLGLVLIGAVWVWQPLARPVLPRAALGLIVLPPFMAAAAALQLGGSVLTGKQIDLRRGELFSFMGQNGALLTAQGVSAAWIETVGDVPVRLVLRARAGPVKRLSRGERSRSFGIDPGISIAELSDTVRACLAIEPAIVEVDGSGPAPRPTSGCSPTRTAGTGRASGRATANTVCTTSDS